MSPGVSASGDAMELKDVPCRSAGVQRPGFSARRGFTLIELLVVMGVIGLLIAILVPSLARGREQARTVNCQANLSQLGKALLLYATDYRSTLPYEDRGEESVGRICWYDAIDTPYLGRAKADKRVKICPTVALDDKNSEESYRMNSKLAEAKQPQNPGDPNYYRPYRRLDLLPRSADTVVLFDGDTGGTIVSHKGRWREQDDDVSYRHNKCTNLLMADWHVMGILKNVLKAKSIKNSPIIWQPADVGPWDPKE
jgi:prepilin-type N-terminal cleavage/methylation domain-containing protein/prepilin-type processing-associated H-X9-DG protein